ncbi:MAG: hypothetical protein R3211_08940 [Balneolaceae bacterium]|nr:hypothetical protein [Balneolaceae bacterium]
MPEVYAQTCSCAGAPLISSQSISSVSGGNLLLGLSYDYQDISNVFSGSDPLEDPSVKRSTQSILFEANYGLTDRLTVSGTFTFIKKRRESGLQSPGPNNVVTTQHLGDGVLMLKYVLHKNTIQSQYQLAVGAGAKLPLGITGLTNNGLQLNMDMQPGTGAWDGIAWSYLSKTFAPASTINLFLINSFRLTGRNERFRGSDAGYKFGNEFVSTLGATDKLFSKFSYIVLLRYRSASSDKLGDTTMPNTGGKWVTLSPGINYRATDRISLRLSGSVPIYQYLNGLQPTIRYMMTGSLFYNLKSRTVF